MIYFYSIKLEYNAMNELPSRLPASFFEGLPASGGIN